jgi:hypothetical protein
MLATKWERAQAGIETTKTAFDQLSLSVTKESQEKWTEEEAEALKKGGEHMSIYDVSGDAGQFLVKFTDHATVLTSYQLRHKQQFT